MIKTKNYCYDCPRPCSGSCHRNQMSVRICDDCCDTEADYVVDGEDLCSTCLKIRIRQELDEMIHDLEKAPNLHLKSIAEQLNYDIEEI